MIRKIIVFLLLTATISGISCSYRPQLERPKGMPELLPCSISVTFGGNVIEGVMVSLIPIESNSDWKPSGTTDKNGTAILSTSYGFKGVPAGKYTVAFVRVVENPNYNENDSKSMPNRSLIPLKYGLKKSTEQVEVKTGEKNVFSFALDAGEEFVR